MTNVGLWLIGAVACLVLPALAHPVARRPLVQLAGRLSEWSQDRYERQNEPTEEEQKLYQWSKRRRLCAAIARIEHLLATDSWMSATRQLGNRLAYGQLLSELRRTPDVFPSSLDAPPVDLWGEPLHTRRTRRHHRVDEPDGEIDWSDALPVGCTTTIGAVEILEIGWRRTPRPHRA